MSAIVQRMLQNPRANQSDPTVEQLVFPCHQYGESFVVRNHLELRPGRAPCLTSGDFQGCDFGRSFTRARFSLMELYKVKRSQPACACVMQLSLWVMCSLSYCCAGDLPFTAKLNACLFWYVALQSPCPTLAHFAHHLTPRACPPPHPCPPTHTSPLPAHPGPSPHPCTLAQPYIQAFLAPTPQ